MRTTEEILARIAEVEPTDLFGVERSGLLQGLTMDDAAQFLGTELTEERWAEIAQDPAKSIADYLPFAIGKALDHRGLSASRSVDHMRGWVWLMGDDKFDAVDWSNYQNYGVPVLKRCAELVGYDWPADNERLQRMADGLACIPDCEEGCAS